MQKRMREMAARQSQGTALDVGGPLIRSATQDLEDAKERRSRIGKYAPDEEARQRARAKFRRALSKIKVKGLTNKMLQASRKKKTKKSLKRVNSETWEHGGEAGRERRRAARRKSIAKRAARKERKSRRKGRRATMQVGDADEDGNDVAMAAALAAQEAMDGNSDLSNMIDTVIEEGDEAEHAD